MQYIFEANGDGTILIAMTLNPQEISELISFDNSHLVAQALTSNPEAARALYEELHYWASNNQI